MNDTVAEIPIIGPDGRTLFDRDDIYRIPIYQRAYAWDKTQIRQLIEDVAGLSEGDTHYYLGVLTVNRSSEGHFEVIDGQQRLTTLFLLLSYIGQKVDPDSLVFSCRNKATETLKLMAEGANLAEGSDLRKICDKNLLTRYEDISDILNDKNLTAPFASLVTKLSKTVLFRAEVPRHTELNRYFEVMNSRGKQLENHEVLKSRLMSALESDSERDHFAGIWEACSNMSGYVQMSFAPEARTLLFGPDWTGTETVDGKEANQLCPLTQPLQKLQELPSNAKVSRRLDQEEWGEYRDDKFTSLVNFPYFLIYTLRSLLVDKGISDIKVPLDDKKLLESFEDSKLREHWKSDSDFSRDFIGWLLRSRFLFDKYIIKRMRGEDAGSNGDWSLKKLNSSSSGGSRTANPVNTFSDEALESDILMLQACLRVTSQSPQSPWLPDLMSTWTDEFLEPDGFAERYRQAIEVLAIADVKDWLEGEGAEKDYQTGLGTPHIVFNYLDYLLWKNDRWKKEVPESWLQSHLQEKFVFEYRDTIEHWYPQHPSDKDLAEWAPEDGLNRFGNLCLLQRDINAQFSNDPPTAKRGFDKKISHGSLKLRIMAAMTPDNNDEWINHECGAHEEAMLRILKEAVEAKTPSSETPAASKDCDTD